MAHWIVNSEHYYQCPICRYTYDNRIDHVSDKGECPNCLNPIEEEPVDSTKGMDKTVLVVKTKIHLPAREMGKLYDLLVEQVKSGVVLIPPYFDVEIIQCPEDVEVRFDVKGENE